MKRVVNILRVLMDTPEVFCHILRILQPTISHSTLGPMIVEAGLVKPFMDFVCLHLPEYVPFLICIFKA